MDFLIFRILHYFNRLFVIFAENGRITDYRIEINLLNRIETYNSYYQIQLYCQKFVTLLVVKSSFINKIDYKQSLKKRKAILQRAYLILNVAMEVIYCRFNQQITAKKVLQSITGNGMIFPIKDCFDRLAPPRGRKLNMLRGNYASFGGYFFVSPVFSSPFCYQSTF